MKVEWKSKRNQTFIRIDALPNEPQQKSGIYLPPKFWNTTWIEMYTIFDNKSIYWYLKHNNTRDNYYDAQLSIPYSIITRTCG